MHSYLFRLSEKCFERVLLQRNCLTIWAVLGAVKRCGKKVTDKRVFNLKQDGIFSAILFVLNFCTKVTTIVRISVDMMRVMLKKKRHKIFFILQNQLQPSEMYWKWRISVQVYPFIACALSHICSNTSLLILLKSSKVLLRESRYLFKTNFCVMVTWKRSLNFVQSLLLF